MIVARLFAGFSLVALVHGIVVAQTPAPPASKPPEGTSEAVAALESGNTPAAATVEKIMQQAVRNIARRYNLNEAQTAETDKLMKREVHKFLKEHEAEVWPAIRDLLAVQLGGRQPTPEEAMRIGKAAKPLIGKAKDAIIRGNEEWRMYLTPEQKITHDFDLAEMDKQFQQMDKNFNDWAAGTPTDSGLFPPPPAQDRSPPRPKKPANAGLPEPEVETFRLTIFDTFVEEFIRENQLDQGQVDSARSILKEYKAKANEIKEAKKEELQKIDADQKAALAARDRDKMKAADAALKKALESVQALFGPMEERLKGLLTTLQLERYVARRPGGAAPSVEVAPKNTVPPPTVAPPAEKPAAAPTAEPPKAAAEEPKKPTKR